MGEFNLEECIAFRHEARLKTWANESDEFKVSSPPGIKRYEYKRGPWTFSDEYSGYGQGGGRELVTFEEMPAWHMGYFGGGKKECFKFLKEALRNAEPERPRGPFKFEDDERTYRSGWPDFKQFADFETIVAKDGELEWMQFYHGGLIVHQKNSEGVSKLVTLPAPLESRLRRGERNRLPRKRAGFTQEARVAGHKIYVRTGEYPDGALGEIFLDMHKEGQGLRSVLNCFAMAISVGLQYGVPLKEYVDLFFGTRFEPQGPVDHPKIKMTTSVIDYVFRVLGLEYLGMTELGNGNPLDERKPEAPKEEKGSLSQREFCSNCGGTVIRCGTVAKCVNCGDTSGK